MTLVILPPGKLKYFLLTNLHFMIADTSYPEVGRRAFLTEGKRRVKVQKIAMPEKIKIVKEGLKASLYNSQSLKISVNCIELLYSPDTKRQYMILLLSFSTRGGA